MKWAGGKSRLLDTLLASLPGSAKARFPTYAEPFCGGGAMFFRLAAENRFERAFLADKNPELVTLYQVIKADVEPLIRRLRRMQDAHDARSPAEQSLHFYEVRRQSTEGMAPVDRAARLVFLNRTCFNGLWRVNASGQFNVPFGKYDKPKILDADVLRSANVALARATIVEGDFASVLGQLKRGDFAYFDPPYVPVSKTASFTAYAVGRFGPEEQARLVRELLVLRKRGVNAMLSNAATAATRKLYEEQQLFVRMVKAGRSINSDPSKRGSVDELVVTTYSADSEAGVVSCSASRASNARRTLDRRAV